VRADRLLAILLLLHAHEQLTTPQLAGQLAVSARTIHRDLEALAAAGIPVYAERGRSGGWRLLEGYRAQIPALSASELAMLSVLGASDTLAAVDLGGSLQQALRKLSAALPGLQQEAAQIAGRLHIEAGNWFQSDEQLPWLGTVQQAVWHNHVLHLEYTRADGSRGSREVEPYGLVVQAGIWYLLAQTADGRRVFRVGRIRCARLAGAGFQRPTDFDLAADWRAMRARFLAHSSRYRVELLVEAPLLPMVRRILNWPHEFAVAAASDGRMRIELSFDSLEIARFCTLGCGMLVEVVAPGELREALREAVRAMAEQYGAETG
jgi:predicted DNA-binding transcriptional regulator YafY